MKSINKELRLLRLHRKQIKNVITSKSYLNALDALEQKLLKMKGGAK